MRFFKFLIAALAVTGGTILGGGCGAVDSPTAPAAMIISFDELELPSYKFVNDEIILYRMVLRANQKDEPIEAFAWDVFLQNLTLSKWQLFAYKDVAFSTPAYKTNPVAVNDRKIPDGKPDYYYVA